MSFHLHQNFRDRRGTDVWVPDGASSYDRAKTNRTGYIVAMCVCVIGNVWLNIFCVYKMSVRISGSTGEYYFI